MIEREIQFKCIQYYAIFPIWNGLISFVSRRAEFQSRWFKANQIIFEIEMELFLIIQTIILISEMVLECFKC